MTSGHPAPSLVVRFVQHDIADPFITPARACVESHLAEFSRVAAEHFGPSAGRARKRSSAIDRSSSGTAAFLKHVPSAAAWLDLVPTAAALDPLYDPRRTVLPNGGPIDQSMREWFANIADARGIRSRAEVMKTLLGESSVVGSDARWLSLACGAAQPIFDVLGRMEKGDVVLPQVTLADLDKKALRLAAVYARTHGLSTHTTLRRLNVLDRRGFGRLPGTLGVRRPSGLLGAFDVVDAVGLLEYLRVDDWIYTYNGVISTKKTLAGAVTFIRNAFECVRPGGLLIVGNMLDTHPQLGFTMDVIQWPHIQPRSVEEMLWIFERAGLVGGVAVHLPSDGVYAIYAIRKPA